MDSLILGLKPEWIINTRHSPHKNTFTTQQSYRSCKFHIGKMLKTAVCMLVYSWQ